jgi:hypothetical protein
LSPSLPQRFSGHDRLQNRHSRHLFVDAALC